MRTTKPILILLATAGIALAACGSDSSSSSYDRSTTVPPTASPTTAPTAAGPDTTVGGPVGAATATVSVSTSPTLGEYLVGPNGHTLYVFDKDQGTTSACSGGCLDNWPALVADAPTAGTGVDAAELSTAAGSQVVYHGHLLYYYAGDSAAGDANGAGIPSWHAVDASGAAISG